MQLSPDGKYWDQVRKRDGKLHEFGWRSNIVVDQCRELIAGFMLGGTSTGIQQLRLGRGESHWDNNPPPAPVAATTMLTDTTPTIISGSALNLQFLDAVGNETTTPTHRIQVAVTLDSDTLSISGSERYPLREFALFGQFDGEDYMIDYVRHPVMSLSVGDTLIRKIRLVF
ncbi:hypothetical protein [Teredinibacter purpureus]|uniref:hypothetical protein n=1 Tax=Teredinibacter purpureus TaxID=2731756 RepID=UPI0005F86C76|nr:hypothetical protein [Teredinibacter purpureus]